MSAVSKPTQIPVSIQRLEGLKGDLDRVSSEYLKLIKKTSELATTVFGQDKEGNPTQLLADGNKILSEKTSLTPATAASSTTAPPSTNSPATNFQDLIDRLCTEISRLRVENQQLNDVLEKLKNSASERSEVAKAALAAIGSS